MIGFTGALKVYLALEPQDMRKSFNGLYAAAQEQLGEWSGCCYQERRMTEREAQLEALPRERDEKIRRLEETTRPTPQSSPISPRPAWPASSASTGAPPRPVHARRSSASPARAAGAGFWTLMMQMGLVPQHLPVPS